MECEVLSNRSLTRLTRKLGLLTHSESDWLLGLRALHDLVVKKGDNFTLPAHRLVLGVAQLIYISSRMTLCRKLMHMTRTAVAPDDYAKIPFVGIDNKANIIHGSFIIRGLA